jgi:hypothetical protein
VSGESSSGSVSIDDAAATSGPTGSTEPTSTVSHDQQTKSHPAGSAMPEGGIPVTEKPEALVAGAFAGGFILAWMLKKLGR